MEQLQGARTEVQQNMRDLNEKKRELLARPIIEEGDEHSWSEGVERVNEQLETAKHDKKLLDGQCQVLYHAKEQLEGQAETLQQLKSIDNDLLRVRSAKPMQPSMSRHHATESSARPS